MLNMAPLASGSAGKLAGVTPVETQPAAGVPQLSANTGAMFGMAKGPEPLVSTFAGQVIVGPKGLAEGKVELKRRAGGERESLATVDLLARIRRV